MKEKFLEIVKQNINREGITYLLEWLEKSDFYIAPASTKYHLCCEGGLLQHSLGVYERLKNVLLSNNITEYSDETIAIVSLMHDICKCNFYKKVIKPVKNEQTNKWETKETYEIDDQFPIGHGEKSAIILQNYLKLTTDELYAIRWHMSGFDNAVKGGEYGISKAYEKCKLAVALSIADMEATYFLENETKNDAKVVEDVSHEIQIIINLCKENIEKGIDKEIIYGIISSENKGRKNPNTIQSMEVANKIIKLLREKLNG